MKMKIKFKYLLMTSFLTSMNGLIAMESNVLDLPTVPHKILKHTNLDSYPVDCLEKANEAYNIFHSDEVLTPQKIQKGIALLIETAQAGDPYSLESLAYIVLYGQHGVSQNIRWAGEMLIYLAENELTDAWNVLNALDSNIVKLIEEDKKDEACELFLQSWENQNH